MAFSGLARNINIRACRALDSVAEAFAEAADAEPATQLGDWKRRIRPARQELLTHVDLTYFLKNSFWARVYDFHVSTSVPRDDQACPLPQDIRVQYGGVIKAGAARFEVKAGTGSALAAALSADAQIKKLIKDLNLTDVRILGDEDPAPVWQIDTVGITGSYTWNFVPPIFQAIRYREEEVQWHLSLLAMLARLAHEANEACRADPADNPTSACASEEDAAGGGLH